MKSAQSYATAERDLWFPTISAVGVAGLTPYRQDPLAPRYAAAGFNVNIPIFNGRQFNALHAEASAEASAQQQYLRDLQNSIARDVRTAWLNANLRLPAPFAYRSTPERRPTRRSISRRLATNSA